MKKKYGYMCSVDFDHHIESDAFGTNVFLSEEALRRNRTCVNNNGPTYCGIVKVKVKIVKVIQKEYLYDVSTV